MICSALQHQPHRTPKLQNEKYEKVASKININNKCEHLIDELGIENETSKGLIADTFVNPLQKTDHLL